MLYFANSNISCFDCTLSHPFQKCQVRLIYCSMSKPVTKSKNPWNCKLINLWRVKLMANVCFNPHQSLWSCFQSKQSLESVTDAFLGHPVKQFLRNSEMYNLIFNGFGLPWPSKFLKYMSLCLPNSNVIIFLPGCCAL